jgi:hypothetical protein
MSVRPNEPTPLPLDEFSLNLIFLYFLENFSGKLNDKNKSILPEDLHTVSNTSRSVHLE